MASENKFAWLEALRLLSQPFVLVLWLVTFVDSFVLNAYFYWAATFLGSPQVGIKGNWIMPIMSIGQIAEILAMAILAMTLKKLGWRTTMILGISAHVVRFAVFAFFPQWTALIIVVFILHGICYAFFFATVYIFVDEYFPKDARSSAQGLFNVMILGLGVMASNTLCPFLTDQFSAGHIIDFRRLFLMPCGVALAAAVTLVLFFHPPKLKTAETTRSYDYEKSTRTTRHIFAQETCRWQRRLHRARRGSDGRRHLGRRRQRLV